MINLGLIYNSVYPAFAYVGREANNSLTRKMRSEDRGRGSEYLEGQEQGGREGRCYLASTLHYPKYCTY